MSVGVGSELDPHDFIGFMHLMEHMLFTGSKNYPEDNYIEKVVNRHSGQNNATTGCFATTYFYSIAEEGLEEFLDVLVDAIANPNLDAKTVKKEVNNVNSEISMRMTYNKAMGHYKLLKEVGHPDAKILHDAYANIEADKVDFDKLQKDLVEMHAKYYSANIMRLVIIGDKRLEEVEKIAQLPFSKIPNNNIERPLFNEPETYVQPFGKDALGSVYYLQGFHEPSKLVLVFIAPSTKTETTFLPTYFLSILLFYYAEGSFKYRLLEENLITGMDLDGIWEDYVNSVFSVHFALTEKGEKNVSRVIQLFYSFIEHIKSMKDRKEVYSTISDISKFAFLFKTPNPKLGLGEPNEDSFRVVHDYAKKLLNFKVDELFRARHVFEKYDDDRFVELLDSMRIENSIVILESKRFKNISNNHADSNAAAKDTAGGTPKGSGAEDETERKGRILIDDKSDDIAKGQRIEFVRRIMEESPSALQSSQRGEIKSGDGETLGGYFDASIESVLLDKNFSFDNKRAYAHMKLPEAVVKSMKAAVAGNDVSYASLSPISTSFIAEYSVLSTCKAPDSLKPHKGVDNKEPAARLLHAADLKTVANDEEAKALETRSIDTFKTYDLIFSPKDNNIEPADQQALRELQEFKSCLYGDFVQDTKERRVQVLENSGNASLWYKLYRVNLQPKSIVIYVIESESLFRKIFKDAENATKHILQLEIFCHYIEYHVELAFPEDFIKGHDFECRRNNFGLLLQFSGLSNILDDFATRVIDYVFRLSDPAAYKEFLINKIKTSWVNKFSNFKTKDARALGMYYLNYAIDKLYLDYSTDESARQLKQILESTGPAEIAAFVGDINENIRVTVFSIGTLPMSTAMGLYEHMKTNHMGSNNALSSYLTEPRTRSRVQAALSVDPGPGRHKVLRVANNDPSDTNNIYISTFRMGILTKKEHLFAKLLARYLHEKVFHRLRNEENLGYVAGAHLYDVHAVS